MTIKGHMLRLSSLGLFPSPPTLMIASTPIVSPPPSPLESPPNHSKLKRRREISPPPPQSKVPHASRIDLSTVNLKRRRIEPGNHTAETKGSWTNDDWAKSLDHNTRNLTPARGPAFGTANLTNNDDA